MAIFNIGYTDLSYQKYLGNSSRYNEVNYDTVEIIKGVIYGDNEYKRDNDSTNTISGYTCQTLYNVSLKDKINGYIVTAIDSHYNIFGFFEYNEVSLING